MTKETLKVAIIGQSQFAVEVLQRVRKKGHEIVGVFTIPDDKNGREDPVAKIAKDNDIKVFKYKAWRRKGVALQEVLDEYKSVGATLNVMPYCSQFIPMEVINHPKHKSICYHPSLLPRHRGASAISWTLIEGDKKSGFTVFWADEGLDTGPILLQRECPVDDNDTVDTLYKNFMYPEGIKAMEEAVELVANGTAPKICQSEDGATYDAFLNKKELCQLKFEDKSAQDLHNFIRGLDSSPGAWTNINGKETKLFGSSLWNGDVADVEVLAEVEVEGSASPGIVHQSGMLLSPNNGSKKKVNIKLLQVEGKFVQASKFGQGSNANEVITLTEDEEKIRESIRAVWQEILKIDVKDDTDFFAAGAGSMNVVQLVEEVKDRADVTLANEDVFLNTSFGDLIQCIIKLKRGGGIPKATLNFEPVKMSVNKLDISFAKQLYINGEFVNATSGKKLRLINPHDESLICEVESASREDVDRAVDAAEKAFYDGEWSKMNARDRGKLLLKLADLMEEHKEELATIESIDSGAVYTLALKTHVGMSIETWRYFSGWCDKIQGATIPINNARPNRNLSITKREPIGVCGLITPWNYPLMMLSWKMAACLAAGNTVIIKPAQVCPLTALKFAELSFQAGIPPGVINVLPGSGGVCGQAMAEHPRIRKLGFTGSTEIGHTIMKTCAVSNLKKVSLELGGKSPLIIFGDCDVEKAVKNAISGAFFNKGENCIAAGRIFVEEKIYDSFLEKVTQETNKMKIGNPLDRGTAHGPQNHKAHLDKLLDYCRKGVAEGARLVAGGKRYPDLAGLYMIPTIFADVEDHMFIAKEESFGPIMVVSKFPNDDIEGVLRRANNTEFGLASGVFTKDINKALYVSEKIEAGTCFVNTYNKTDVAAPFGGFKQSGFGKDLGQEALNEYLKTKTITFEYSS